MDAVSRLSILELAIFRQLGAGKTIREIAGVAFLGHPSVSKHIHAAERRLGLPLVEQRGRRLYLTQAGAVVAAAADDVGRRMETLEADLRMLEQGETGLLRIVATSTPATYVLPPLVEEFLEGRPNARVVVHAADAEDLWESFEAQRYELGVGPFVPATLARDAEPFYEDRLAFFVHPDSQVAPEIAVADLRHERLVGAFSQSGWQAIWQDIAVASQGLEAVRKLDLGAVEAVKRQVETRGGIGVLFELALRSDFASGRFRQVTVQGLSYSRAFQLVPRRSSPPLVRAFADFLRARIRA